MKRMIWFVLGALAPIPAATALSQEAPEEAEANVGAEQVVEEAPKAYEPLLSTKLGGVSLTLPLSLSERVEAVSSFPVDADGTLFTAEPTFNTQVRIGASLNTNLVLSPVRFVAEAEVDALTGQHSGGSELVGEFVPDSGEVETQLRKGSLQLDVGPLVHFTGGFTVSHWGMGLLANDGAHGWTPGSASFVDPRGGDRVLRGSMVLGPFLDNGLLIIAGVDQVEDDDALFEEDEALQVLTSIVYGVKGGPFKGGAYVVSRSQKNSVDGDTTNVVVFDATASYTRKTDAAVYTFEGEVAFINGETTLSPSPDFPTHDVKQFGMALRASLDFGIAGGVLDVLLASGDDNFDDGIQAGFKVDRNFPLGLITHRYVLGAQSARGPVTASNLDLVGQPAEDLERFPTQGAITNTVALFPRGWVRPFEGLEIYGGPLVTFTEGALADPFNTRIGGGAPRNALDGDPGKLLGAELDLGIRYRSLIAGSELTIGIEGGVFLPGDALEDSAGETMGQVTAGRAMIDYRF